MQSNQGPYGYPPPPYGAPYPPAPPPRRGIGTLATLAIVFACLFGGCFVLAGIGNAVKKSEATEASGRTPATTPPATAAMSVTATELFDAYHANEVAGDERFKGRALRVSGTVQSVDKDFAGSITVRFETSNQFIPVDAHVLASEKSSAARLSKGLDVSIVCIGEGMVIGRPQLGKCRFP